MFSLASIHASLCMPYLCITKQSCWMTNQVMTDAGTCVTWWSFDYKTSKNLKAFNIAFIELAHPLSDLSAVVECKHNTMWVNSPLVHLFWIDLPAYKGQAQTAPFAETQNFAQCVLVFYTLDQACPGYITITGEHVTAWCLCTNTCRISACTEYQLFIMGSVIVCTVVYFSFYMFVSIPFC